MKNKKTIVIVLLIAGALIAYYFYKKNKEEVQVEELEDEVEEDKGPEFNKNSIHKHEMDTALLL